jgi:6-phospho-beta-glucosidase
MRPATRISVIGGGAFLPRLCQALAEHPAVPRLELRVGARRFDRLELLVGEARRRLERLRPSWSIRAFPDVAQALAGAEWVLLLVRVGGLEARARDEDLARAYGQVGDEGLGIGGMSNAGRTLPVLQELAATIRGQAPEARVLNLMAPLGITTRALRDAGLDALGICELPRVTRRRLARAGEAGGAEDGLDYGGLNHLGWFWARDAAAQDLLERAAETGLVDRATWERFGAAPLHYYYDVFDVPAGRRIGRERAPGRAAELVGLSRAIVRALEQGGDPDAWLAARSTPWFDEAVAPILSALLGGESHRSFANFPNRTGSGEVLIPGLPDGLVVEVGAVFDTEGVRPLRPQAIPAPVSEFLRAVGEAEELLYRAARERRSDLLERSLRRIPLPLEPSANGRLSEAILKEWAVS